MPRTGARKPKVSDLTVESISWHHKVLRVKFTDGTHRLYGNVSECAYADMAQGRNNLTHYWKTRILPAYLEVK